MRTPHTSFIKGSKIRIILRDGTQIISKFIQKEGRKRIKLEAGTVNIIDIRSANYYKPHPHERM